MPRVCRFRFSLRQVAILLTLACLTCGMVKAYVEVREQRRVAEHVQEVLEGPNRSLLISYSTVGHRAFELTSYDDQGRLVAELVRVLNEPKSRLPHRDEAIRALRKLSNRPGTLEGMIALLDANRWSSNDFSNSRTTLMIPRGTPPTSRWKRLRLAIRSLKRRLRPPSSARCRIPLRPSGSVLPAPWANCAFARLPSR
jgi:hypothetical protein